MHSRGPRPPTLACPRTCPCPCSPADPAALFESYHLRHDVAAAVFNKLPVLKGFPVDKVPQAPRPNDSELYVSIKDRWGASSSARARRTWPWSAPPPAAFGTRGCRPIPKTAVQHESRHPRRRVRKEVFRGAENRGAHRRGSELAAIAVLTFAVASYCIYARWTGFVTGLLLGGCRRAAVHRGGGGFVLSGAGQG